MVLTKDIISGAELPEEVESEDTNTEKTLTL